LLATKLNIPPPRRNLVSRPRLVERFRGGLGGKLTLIAAPAGSGKTTLVTDWCASQEGRGTPVAWVSLDAADSDQARFWTHVVSALNGLRPGTGDLALSLLTSPQPPAIEGVLTALVNDLADLPTDAVLILDDYHLVDAPSIHAAMTFLLEHLPPQLHLVLTTRADPSLPLARLRGRGDLVEIRAADLRFSADETRAFFNETMGLGVADADAATLEARTEGWIAGLQLAGLALRGQTDRDAFIAGFAGSNRFVVDYLAEEVMQRQPEEVQAFLLKTSILGRMCGSLCDAVLANGPDTLSGQDMLETFEKTNLFVIPLDGERRWYRYHHLFADVLRARLGARWSDGTAALHLSASEWFAGQGYFDEAIEHALDARAFERAASLIEEASRDGVVSRMTDQRRVERWLANLPPDLVRSRSILAFTRAAQLLVLDVDGAETWLDDAERALPPDERAEPDVRGEIAWARALIAAIRGDSERALREAEVALASLRPDNRMGRFNASLALCLAYVNRQELSLADASIANAIHLARSVQSDYSACLAASIRTYVQRLYGGLGAAVATAREAIAWSERLGPATRANVTLVLISLADLLLEQGDLDAAEDCATDALARARRWASPDVLALSILVAARVRQARGDTDAALALCSELRGLAEELDWLTTIVSGFETQLHLTKGDLASAGRVQVAPDPRLRARPRFLSYTWQHSWIAPAQVPLAQGRAQRDDGALQRALAALDDLEADAGWLPGLRIKTLALRALVHDALADSASALAEIREALAMAEPEGYVRLFLDEGEPMADMLRTARDHGIAPTYVERLLAFGHGQTSEGTAPPALSPRTTGPGARSAALVEQLSVRELEVLRLIAAGESNAEIARNLVVAASTVKTHINNIFGKLGVRSRTQAVARARDLSLLQ
jgi:LuxR family maltose regulon positive regulatory protein